MGSIRPRSYPSKQPSGIPPVEGTTTQDSNRQHFLRCLPTPLLPVPSQFDSRDLEDRSVVDALMREWGHGMKQETPRTHLLGAIRKYTIPYLGARTEGHVTFLTKLAVVLTHKSVRAAVSLRLWLSMMVFQNCYKPVNYLLCRETIGEMTWQWT